MSRMSWLLLAFFATAGRGAEAIRAAVAAAAAETAGPSAGGPWGADA